MFVFQNTKGFWSLVNFHVKSSEESTGSASSGKPHERSPGMLLKKQTTTNIYFSIPAPCKTRLRNCLLFLGIYVVLGVLFLGLCIILQLLNTRPDFAWLPLDFKNGFHCYFKHKSALPLVRGKEKSIHFSGNIMLVQFLY